MSNVHILPDENLGGVEGLEILESQINWSMNRIEYLTKCLDEEREQLERYKREREKFVRKLKEDYGLVVGR